MPQDSIGWIIVLAALALGFAIGRASGRSAAQRDLLAGTRPVQAHGPARLAPEVRAQAQAALASGNKILAIKLVRDATGIGLKEAKEAIEQLAGER